MKTYHILLLLRFGGPMILIMRNRVEFEAYKVEHAENNHRILDSLLTIIQHQDDEILMLKSRSNPKQMSDWKFHKRMDSITKALDYEPEKYRENGQ